MAFFEWDENYSVKVREIDQQHRRLIELINQLHEAMKEGNRGKTTASAVDELDTMAAVLDELNDYASYHFSAEEAYMREYGYPEYAPHKELHGQFADRVQAFQQDFDEGQALSSVEILEFIKDWWRQHILNVDKKYAAFFNEKGLS